MTTEKSARDRAAEVMIYVGCALGGFLVGALMFYCIFKCREIKREEKRTEPAAQMQEPSERFQPVQHIQHEKNVIK